MVFCYGCAGHRDANPKLRLHALDANPKLRQHALYTVVNILTGSESHKEAVATSNLPTLLLHHMRTSSNPDVSVLSCFHPASSPACHLLHELSSFLCSHIQGYTRTRRKVEVKCKLAAPQRRCCSHNHSNTLRCLCVCVSITPGRKHQCLRDSCTGSCACLPSQVRLPAVWCVINMTWPDANSAAGVAARAQRLKELGAEDVLSVLQVSPLGVVKKPLDLQTAGTQALRCSKHVTSSVCA
eukprot:745676-Pelagomonas_calceolata.AAC.2